MRGNYKFSIRILFVSTTVIAAFLAVATAFRTSVVVEVIGVEVSESQTSGATLRVRIVDSSVIRRLIYASPDLMPIVNVREETQGAFRNAYTGHSHSSWLLIPESRTIEFVSRPLGSGVTSVSVGVQVSERFGWRHEMVWSKVFVVPKN